MAEIAPDVELPIGTGYLQGERCLTLHYPGRTYSTGPHRGVQWYRVRVPPGSVSVACTAKRVASACSQLARW